MHRAYWLIASWCVAALSVAAVAEVAPAPSLPRFMITSLDTFDAGPEPRAINSAGTVAGNVYSPGSAIFNDAFVQPRGGAVQLLPRPAGALNTVATGLNDNGWVIGSADNIGGVIWSPTGELIPLAAADVRPLSEARAINNRNQIVGFVNGAGYLRDPDGRMTHLGGLPGGSAVSPTDISDSGYVVGGGLVGMIEHAFRRTPDGRVQDLGDLEGGRDSSAAYAVNEIGHVAGVGSTFSGDTPFFWSPETGMVNLGDLLTIERPAVARDVNDHDWVVGDTLGSPESTLHAFLWTPQAGLHDLNDLIDASSQGWAMNVAWQVTDAGEILGLASRNGTVHIVLATPVPEPSLGMLIVLAASAASSRRTRWRGRAANRRA